MYQVASHVSVGTNELKNINNIDNQLDATITVY